MRRHRADWANGSVTSTLNLTQIELTQKRARCSDGNGTLSSLFFSDDDFEIARAQAICRSCSLQTTCLQGALEREETCGVWGGMIVQNGVPTARRRRRGRPSHQPLDFIMIDEVPVPPHLVA
ncbi:MAG: WhiB family redox-sensing transcriptional regulator [Ilumatobacter sp.]|jgi:WhiB family redox-sensing transcriptional regulator